MGDGTMWKGGAAWASPEEGCTDVVVDDDENQVLSVGESAGDKSRSFLPFDEEGTA